MVSNIKIARFKQINRNYFKIGQALLHNFPVVTPFLSLVYSDFSVLMSS